MLNRIVAVQECDVRPRQNDFVGLACRYGRARNGEERNEARNKNIFCLIDCKAGPSP